MPGTYDANMETGCVIESEDQQVTKLKEIDCSCIRERLNRDSTPLVTRGSTFGVSMFAELVAHFDHILIRCFMLCIL